MSSTSLSPMRSSTAPRILVFDSGVGGLSIFTEIQQKLPNASIIYASDNAAFPYGTKGEAELIERVDAVLHKVIAEHPVDIIVIACNTASTLTLPHVRRHFALPVVGVVPAIKPAAALSKSQVIGLLATPATIARAYTHALIHEHAPNAQVISVGSSELVHLAEHKLRGGEIESAQIAHILKPFFEHSLAIDLDVLVLACTHFPLLHDEIAQHFGENVKIIDSGEAIARRVDSLLTHRISYDKHTPEHWAIFTKASPAIDALTPQLHRFNIDNIAIIDV